MPKYRTMSVGGSPSPSPAPDPSRAPAPSYRPEVSYRLEADTSAEAAARAREAEAKRKATEELKQRIEVAAALHTREFAHWCAKHIGADPDALDTSEKALAFRQYTATVESALTTDRRTAVALLEKDYAPQSRAAPQVLHAIEARVKAAARALFDPIANLLKSVRVIGNVQELAAPLREKFQQVFGYLRRSRICIPPTSKKAAIGAIKPTTS